MTPVRIATYNSPHRLRPHAPTFAELADAGVDIIAAQENADADPRRNAPAGWRWHRPKRARSTVIYWNPRTVTVTKRGAKRLSRPGFRSLRFGVWVDAKTTAGTVRVMSVHLPAFYAKSARTRAEYDHQAAKLARWLNGGTNRIAAGDYNGSTKGSRMAPLVAAARFSDPVDSGPHGTAIDYVAVSKRSRLRPRRTRLGPKGRSDHRAVIVDVG